MNTKTNPSSQKLLCHKLQKFMAKEARTLKKFNKIIIVEIRNLNENPNLISRTLNRPRKMYGKCVEVNENYVEHLF